MEEFKNLFPNMIGGLGQNTRLEDRVVRLSAVCVLLLIVGCNRTPKTDVTQRAIAAPKSADQTKIPQKPLECPGRLASRLVGHKIVLSWNASKSSKGPNDRSLGYCVYRSDHEIVADRLEGCPECRKITSEPIFGLGCVDDFGDDHRTYYYAALSLDSEGQRSKFSNKVAASFRRKKRGPQSSNRQDYPACRPN